ncbi:phosphotransferase enzyme family protein [Moniliophthora roreri MCA 2997]|uniref:Phosphotransferase enzyme family protein n=1 Tax=Moniliophthora roreri (strain MCA 2997) TaxID=1381753 RepID=V2XWZ8_MONRO|nr:phosphotransferase enzyme family protein [Moniliophthora roreri MCA 2997]
MHSMADYCRWLRSLLRDNYSIVLTHGDLHPRKVMVTDTSEGRLIITGIIDWEMAGFYPEYWEALKARNTRDIKDMNYWWDYLPSVISGYGDEIAVDRLVERALE